MKPAEKTLACGALAVLILAAAAFEAATFAAESPLALDTSPESPLSDQEIMINQGRMIAQTECASCHAVTRTDESPRPDTPPLRTVLANYNRAALEIDLIEGMRIGHDDMPRFNFNPRAVEPLLMYLDSIQDWGRAEQTGG